jgi:Tfp pilus assembly protein PilO
VRRRLTRREIVVIAIAAVLALAVPVYLFLFRPKLEEMAVAEQLYAARVREYQQVDATARRFPQAQAERQAVADRLAVAEQRIPRTFEPADVALLLASAIKAGGVQLVELTFPETPPAPAAGSTSGQGSGVLEAPFSLHVRGTFPQAVQFLRFVEVLPRVLSIDTMTFTAGPAPPLLEITIGMKAYVLQ